MVLDDDVEFDKWLIEFEREKAAQARQNLQRINPSKKMTSKPMSKKKFIDEFDVVVK